MARSKVSTSTLQRAARALEGGRHAEARKLLEQTLARTPRHLEALDGLSALECEAGQLERAAELLAQLVELAPREARYQLNLGEVQRRLGRYVDALARTQRALELQPDYAEAWFNKGTLLRQGGQLALALPCLERATDLLPESPALQLGLADALADDGQEARAELHRLCASLLQGTPSSSAASLAERRSEYLAAGQRELALACQYVLGALTPRAAAVWLGACELLRGLGRIEGARAAALRCVRIAPADAHAHSALAATCADAGDYAAAEAAARRALSLDERSAAAHFQLGRIQFDLGDTEAALARYRKLLSLHPYERSAHSSLIFLMPYVAASSQAEVAAEARRWAERHAAPLAGEVRAYPNQRSPDRRLRVGYVSEDFCQHPLANYFLPLLSRHHRDGFEVHCYGSVREPDVITRQVAEGSDVYRDVAGLSDAALAEQIRDDRIDILVDLALHSGNHRLLTFARRPAPVQLCYLGYLGTTGLDSVQYRLTASDLEGPSSADRTCFAEAPLTLQTYWCYQPLLTRDERELVELHPAPREESPFVFGSLNSVHKISGETIALWSAVLRAVAGSVFVLAAPERARARLLGLFEAQGIERSRLTFLPYQTRQAYMASYLAIDLCLDTTPCNGATTHLDGLWMGTPTLSLVGERAGGRAGLHICTRVGLPELITRTPAELVARACELASDRARHALLRAGLRTRLEASPLMNEALFIDDLEAAYRRAFGTWCAAP